MSCNFTDALYEYAKKIHGEDWALEMKGSGDKSMFFLKSLISSHNYLRGLNLECSAERVKMVESERERAYEYAKQHALEHDWFSRERLRAMTVGELANLLHDHEEN